MRVVLFGLVLCGLLACQPEPEASLHEPARPERVRFKATLWEAGPNGRQVHSRLELLTFVGESANILTGEFSTRPEPPESRFVKGIDSGYEFRITPLTEDVFRCAGIWQDGGNSKLRRGQIVEARSEPGKPLEFACRHGSDGDPDAWLEVRIVADE